MRRLEGEEEELFGFYYVLCFSPRMKERRKFLVDSKLPSLALSDFLNLRYFKIV